MQERRERSENEHRGWNRREFDRFTVAAMIASSVGVTALTVGLGARRIFRTREARRIWSSIERIDPTEEQHYLLLRTLREFHALLEKQGVHSYDDVCNFTYVTTLRRHARCYFSQMESDDISWQVHRWGNCIHNLAEAAHLTRNELIPDADWKKVIQDKVNTCLKKAAQCEQGMLFLHDYGRAPDDCVDSWVKRADNFLELGRMNRAEASLTISSLRRLLDPHFEAVWNALRQETEHTYFPQLEQLDWLLTETKRSHEEVIPDQEWRQVLIEKASLCLLEAEKYAEDKRREMQKERRTFQPDSTELFGEIRMKPDRRIYHIDLEWGDIHENYDPAVIVHIERMNALLAQANARRADTDVELSDERIRKALQSVARMTDAEKAALLRKGE